MLFATGTTSYKLANALVHKLSSITFKIFTVKDSLAFAKEIVHQDKKIFTGSVNVGSFFTNIPLEKMINVCTNFFIIMRML